MAEEMKISFRTDSYAKRLIIFLDILGFKDFVDSSYVEHKEKQVKELFQYFQKQVSDGHYLIRKNGMDFEPSFTFFSDTIVIALPLNLKIFQNPLPGMKPKEAPNEWNYERSMLLHDTCLRVYEIQTQCLLRGLLLRGSITVGEIYIDGNMWFGPGLISAYEHETKVANFPRVILSKEVLSYFKNEIYPHAGLNVEKDSDGFYFVKLLAWGAVDGSRDERHQAREVIAKNLQKWEASHSLEVMQKWQWIASYFNRYVARVGEKGLEPIDS